MEIPLTPLRFLERASSVHPDRTAIIDGFRTFTYAAMAAQVTRLAHGFRAKGLAPGDRVAYLAPNCAEMLVAHFAVPLAGGVLVTIFGPLSRNCFRYGGSRAAVRPSVSGRGGGGCPTPSFS